jgi:hypothetical protein
MTRHEDAKADDELQTSVAHHVSTSRFCRRLYSIAAYEPTSRVTRSGSTLLTGRDARHAWPGPERTYASVRGSQTVGCEEASEVYRK